MPAKHDQSSHIWGNGTPSVLLLSFFTNAVRIWRFIKCTQMSITDRIIRFWQETIAHALNQLWSHSLFVIRSICSTSCGSDWRSQVLSSFSWWRPSLFPWFPFASKPFTSNYNANIFACSFIVTLCLVLWYSSRANPDLFAFLSTDQHPSKGSGNAKKRKEIAKSKNAHPLILLPLPFAKQLKRPSTKFPGRLGENQTLGLSETTRGSTLENMSKRESASDQFSKFPGKNNAMRKKFPHNSQRLTRNSAISWTQPHNSWSAQHNLTHNTHLKQNMEADLWQKNAILKCRNRWKLRG